MKNLRVPVAVGFLLAGVDPAGDAVMAVETDADPPFRGRPRSHGGRRSGASRLVGAAHDRSVDLRPAVP